MRLLFRVSLVSLVCFFLVIKDDHGSVVALVF